MIAVKCLPPWSSIEDPIIARKFATELARETSPGHTLAGVPVSAIGFCSNSDDVVFRLLDGSERLALVHLTWRSSDTPPWPHTLLFIDEADWINRGMLSDPDFV